MDDFQRLQFETAKLCVQFYAESWHHVVDDGQDLRTIQKFLGDFHRLFVRALNSSAELRESWYTAVIYAKGYEKGKPGLAQGIRCGLYVGLMLSVMHSFGWYVILPIPLALAWYWFAAIVVEFVAAGAAAGLVYSE